MSHPKGYIFVCEPEVEKCRKCEYSDICDNLYWTIYEKRLRGDVMKFDGIDDCVILEEAKMLTIEEYVILIEETLKDAGWDDNSINNFISSYLDNSWR